MSAGRRGGATINERRSEGTMANRKKLSEEGVGPVWQT